MAELKFTGRVLASNVVEREWGRKDKDGNEIAGTRAQHRMFEAVLQEDDGTVLQISSIDPTFALPVVGKAWTTPRVVQYSAFNLVPEVRVQA